MDGAADISLPKGAPADAPVPVRLTLKLAIFLHAMSAGTAANAQAPIIIRADARNAKIEIERALRAAGFGGLFG